MNKLLINMFKTWGDDFGFVQDNRQEAVKRIAAFGEPAESAVVRAIARHRNDIMNGGGVTAEELHAEVDADEAAVEAALDALTDRFLTETDNGYRLRYAGKKLYETMLALEHDASAPEMDGQTDHRCPVCRQSARAVYADGDLRYECPDHGEFVRVPIAPTTAAHGDLSQLTTLANLRPKHQLELAQAGVCWNCRGPMDADGLVEPPAESTPANNPPLTRFGCDQCETEFGVLLSQCLSTDGGVQAFFYERGVDLSDTPFIDLEAVIDITHVEQVDDDPMRVRARITHDGEHLTTTLDERMRVRDVEFPAD